MDERIKIELGRLVLNPTSITQKILKKSMLFNNIVVGNKGIGKSINYRHFGFLSEAKLQYYLQ